MKRYPMVTPLLFVLAFGLTLRLFHLGSEDFWVDELGVAQAAFAFTPLQAVDVARSHVMAMPMDYLVAWLMGRVGVKEGWLRLPSAIWGTLTLPAAFLFYRQVMNRCAAARGVFLLALSPVLIMYSQELRFYAPLVFFYTAASALGLRAVRHAKFSDWLAFVAVTIMGIFFHLYVAFAFVNVVASSMAFARYKIIPLRALFVSFCTIFSGAIIALVQFGSLAGEHSSLFTFESPLKVIMRGLGFLPPFPALWMSYLFGIILFALTLLGLYHTGSKIYIGISILIQIGFILALDAWHGYFASMRQLLLLLPLTGMFTARGVSMLLAWLNRMSRRKMYHLSYRTMRTSVVIFLLITASFVIIPYYRMEKTSTRAILNILKSNWEPGELTLVSPPYNLPVYIYYAPWLESDLRPFDRAILTDASFVISEPNVDLGSSFGRLFEPSTPTLYPQVLWIKQ